MTVEAIGKDAIFYEQVMVQTARSTRTGEREHALTSRVLAFMAGPSACVVQVASSDSSGSTLAPRAISLPSAAMPL